MYTLYSGFSGSFSLVYWVKEDSVSVLKSEKVIGGTLVGSESWTISSNAKECACTDNWS